MSRTRIICPGCGFVQGYCQCKPSNEQNTMISQQDSTKECGLEDENAGETLPDRPLVGDTISWEEMQKASKLMEETAIKSNDAL